MPADVVWYFDYMRSYVHHACGIEHGFSRWRGPRRESTQLRLSGIDNELLYYSLADYWDVLLTNECFGWICVLPYTLEMFAGMCS